MPQKKSLALKRQNGAGWNKDQKQGQKRPFRLQDIAWLQKHIAQTSPYACHDLCLLSLGVDSLLRPVDLLPLRVKDVTRRDGSILSELGIIQSKTDFGVEPVIPEETKVFLRNWIKISGKRPHHYLFTRSKEIDALPITRASYASNIKKWAEALGNYAEDFSTHSIRRTRPVHMYWEGIDIGLISKMLGHKDIASTMRYLGITQEKVRQAYQEHPFFTKPHAGSLRHKTRRKI